MSKTAHLLSCAALAAALALAAPPAAALTFVIAGSFPSQIYLRIGATGAAVSVVNFAVTPANAGAGVIDGTVAAAAGAASAETANFPVCPANYVRIVARARSFFANWRTATLTVDSTGGITAGANTIPFTKFDWLSDDVADMPAGAFNGAAGQVLVSFLNSREVGACHRFRFLNDTIYPPGTYTGALTYNLSMP